MKLTTPFYLLPRVAKLLDALRAMRNQDVSVAREHLRLCADWLLGIQEAAGGYMASYSLITGRRHAYIETTGYIVPTMLDLAVALNDPLCRASALRAGEWLLSVQQANGAFTDIDHYLPQVFDTGQVILGLNRLFHETNDTRFVRASGRAADWLVRVQDKDGSWTNAGYHRGRPCTYLTRVATAMIESARITGETTHRIAAEKFLSWAVSRQQPNGFFPHSELTPGAAPVLHTMVYVLEGLLMAHQLTGEQQWLDALTRGARPLLEMQLHRDLVPRSQYRPDWSVANPQKCLPGLAQWAGVCLGLHELTADPDWLEAATLSIYYLKSKQLRRGGILRGALPASIPIWGDYHPMMFPNWAVKFFADSLLLYESHHIPVWREQETWVKKCFELQLDGGGWSANSTKLEPVDRLVGEFLQQELAVLPEGAMVLDLGCSEGRYLNDLQTALPKLRFVGVDPCAPTDGSVIRPGSALRIPLEDQCLQAVYTIQVLQHVHDLEQALAEIRRVLKPGGLLLIGDRDRLSGRGLLKPYHEIKGRWMYPWDSPFRERWHSGSTWRRLLGRQGFRTGRLVRIQNPGDRGWRRWARMNVFLCLRANRDSSHAMAMASRFGRQPSQLETTIRKAKKPRSQTDAA